MRYRLISNLLEFKDLENDWNSLYLKDNENTVFQSFEFNYFSWKYELENNKNSLAIVLAYDSEIIKSIFPFYVDKVCRLRFINDLHADFCDAISIIDVNFNEIIKFVRSNFKIHYFQLVNLKNNCSLLDYSKTNRCSVISDFDYSLLNFNKGVFPDNYFDYKSKHKTEFRRILKINKNKDYKIFDFTDTLFPILQIKNLREKMILLGIRDRSFLPNSQLLLIEELYLNGKLLLSVVSEKGVINAISFIINSQSEYLFWIDMYGDSRLINLCNYILAISSLSSEKSVKINFGRGSYNYKIKNFLPVKKKLFSMFIFSSKYSELKFSLERRLIKLIKHVYNKIK